MDKQYEYVVYLKLSESPHGYRVKGFSTLKEAENLAQAIFEKHLIDPKVRFIKLKPEGQEYHKYLPVQIITEMGIQKLMILSKKD